MTEAEETEEKELGAPPHIPNLKKFMAMLTNTEMTDWVSLYRPTYLHRFTPFGDRDDASTPIILDEHIARFTLREDVRVTLSYGLVDHGDFRVPGEGPLSEMNARTELLDCFYLGRLVFRDTLLRADRRRMLLPMPIDWESSPPRVPKARLRLARLVHELAGPLTDFDENMKKAEFEVVDDVWP